MHLSKIEVTTGNKLRKGLAPRTFRANRTRDRVESAYESQVERGISRPDHSGGIDSAEAQP